MKPGVAYAYSEPVRRVGAQHERVLITVHGAPSAVLIAPADLESLEETIAADRYELIISPSARRQLAETLPEVVAFAAHEFIVGALLDNPHRPGPKPVIGSARSTTART